MRITATTFYTTSTSTMTWYSPPTLGISNIFCHVASSTRLPSWKAACTSATTFYQCDSSVVTFSVVSTLSAVFNLSVSAFSVSAFSVSDFCVSLSVSASVYISAFVFTYVYASVPTFVSASLSSSFSIAVAVPTSISPAVSDTDITAASALRDSLNHSWSWDALIPEVTPERLALDLLTTYCIVSSLSTKYFTCKGSTDMGIFSPGGSTHQYSATYSAVIRPRIDTMWNGLCDYFY